VEFSNLIILLGETRQLYLFLHLKVLIEYFMIPYDYLHCMVKEKRLTLVHIVYIFVTLSEERMLNQV
jgi:hypothetical protein